MAPKPPNVRDAPAEPWRPSNLPTFGTPPAEPWRPSNPPTLGTPRRSRGAPLTPQRSERSGQPGAVLKYLTTG